MDAGDRRTAFKRLTAERLGWYVYLLRDPRDQAVFYVGKGRGNRIFQHGLDAEGIERETPKLMRIREIHAAGLEVDCRIVRHGISSERQAYEVESAVMDAVGLVGSVLLNEVKGHRHHSHGAISAAEADVMYGAVPAPDIEVPALLIRIPLNWSPDMTDEEVLRATAMWWRIGPRRELARYAFAVNHGVVRGTYEITDWRPRQNGDQGWEEDERRPPRWGFDGIDAVAMHRYLHTDVSRYFRKGAQNPVVYVNC